MKARCFLLAIVILPLFSCLGKEKLYLWPEGKTPQFQEKQTKPYIEWWSPKEKKSKACIIIAPGGGYRDVAYNYEGIPARDYFLEKGITVVMLCYRTPRPNGFAKHSSAWMDAQRGIRITRSHAKEWGINPEKIGFMGFSAGGHLTLMAATTSQTPAYPPIDELDKVPCHVNFAVPIYPAYVLQDGENGRNVGKGNNSTFVDDFAFDKKTPTMCLFHGDADSISAMGSVSVYHRLRTMNIPAELHIYAKAVHGFQGLKPGDPMMLWKDRVFEWMKLMQIY